MTDADLKEGYRRLQEQQRRKLERVKELRQGKQQQQQAMETGDLSSRAFGGVADDLQLQTAPSRPGPSGATATEVQDLRDRVRGLDDENARIKKILAEKDFEVTQLRKKMAAQRQRPPVQRVDESVSDVSGLGGGDAAIAKVMELSRRVRELTAELSSEKNKATVATRRLKEMEAKKETVAASAAPEAPKPLDRNEREEFETEMRKLRERVSDLHTQLQTATRELKMAKKALSEETGLQETTSIHEILSGQSNWRGRQQQILQLERQVKEMKRQLAAAQQQQQQDLAELISKAPEMVTSNGATTIGRELLSNTSVGGGSASTFRSSATGISTSASSALGRNQASLMRMQKERRERAEAELKEKKELETEVKELRSKLESARSRIQTVSTENKSLKSQVETLLKKGRHDDELIESMTKREKGLRELLEQSETAKVRLENSQRFTLEQVNQQKMQESQILTRMREIVQDKDVTIQEKESTIETQEELIERLQQRLKMRLNSANDAGDEDDELVVSVQEAKQEVAGENQLPNAVHSNGDALNAREERTEAGKKPPKKGSASSQRPSSSRPATGRSSARSTNTATPTSQRPPSRPGSAASSRGLTSARRPGCDPIELEDVRTQLRAVEVERDRLRELLMVQDGRYREALAARMSAEQQLAGLRRRSTALERQAGSAGGAVASVAAAADMTDVERLVSSADLPVTRATVQQLQEALAMCHEEVDTRKQALKSALEAKQQDVKWLMEIMEKTREVYLTGIQRVKQQQT